MEAFPDGLRMLTGDPLSRSCTGPSKGITWLCLDYSKPYRDETPDMRYTDCPNGLRAQVFFPSCWDGVNVDSPDHSSHMAYPDRIDSGICPPSHPHRLVSLFYEAWFSVKDYNDLNAGGRFVLANGDITGAYVQNSIATTLLSHFT